jgi:branched-chain amino acid transport system permease protein
MMDLGASSTALWSDRTRTMHAAILAVLVAALIVAPAVIYPISILNVLIFALFAASYNLLLSTSGLISFGHAAYLGIAAYITGYSAKMWGLTPELAILLGTAGAALLGAAYGYVAIRRQGIYFAMITMGLAQLVYFLCLQRAEFTGGEDGLTGVPRGDLFGLFSLNSNLAIYYFVLAVVVAAMIFIYRIIESPFGLMLTAIRDNEVRTASLGHRTFRYKHLAFILASAMAGLAGSLKVVVFQLATLSDVHWSMSGLVVLMVLVGGIGTVYGPWVGALVVVFSQTYLAGLGGSWVVVIQGAIFMICVTLFREGIVGRLGILLKRPL